ncbi:MAG: OmpH family outer membrane protein [Bacteroidia bacterium]
MNKNISMILNVILIIAVAILYYLHFSGPKAATEIASKGKDSTVVEKPIVMAPSDIKASKIVFVNLDVLSEQYDYLKDVSAAAQAELSALQNQYQTKGEKLQEDYAAFQKNVNDKLLSENQINAEQEKFAARKDELDQLQNKSQVLEEKNQARTEEARKNLTDYINEYNKSGHYDYVLTYSTGPLSPLLLANENFDITKDILAGINAQYQAKKKAKK